MSNESRLLAIVNAAQLFEGISVQVNAVCFGILGVVFLLAGAFAPVKPGEETMMAIGVTSGVVMVVGAGVAWRWVTKRTARMRQLLLETRSEIKNVNILKINRRGWLTYGIEMFDKTGDRIRVRVGTEALTHELVQLIRTL